MKKEEAKKQSGLIVRRASKVNVVDQKSLTVAEKMLVTVKDFIKGVNDLFDPPIKKAHEAHRAMIAAKKEVADPLLSAERSLKRSVKDYLVEEARARHEAEEKRKFEQEALLAQLEKERDDGDTKLADETFDKIEEIHEESLKVEETPQMAGITKKTLIRWKVSDLDLVPRAYLTVDKAIVDQIVKAKKLEASIPGITVFEDLVIATKRS